MSRHTSPRPPSLAAAGWRSRLALVWVPLGALLFALLAANLPLVRDAGLRLTDWQLRSFAVPVDLSRVLVVDIDEDSLRDLQPLLGGWPYSRDVHARITRDLRSQGAEVVAWNVVFADPREGDDRLREALSETGALVFLAASASRHDDAQDRAPPPSLAALSDPHRPDIDAVPWSTFVLPAPELLAGAGPPPAVDLITIELDPDGVLRRIPPWHAAHGRLLPSMAWATARARPGGAVSERPGEQGLLPWHGSPSEVPTLAFSRLLRAAGDEGWPAMDLAGRAVFIGSSALETARLLTPAGERSGTAALAIAHAAVHQGRSLAPAGPVLMALLVGLALLPSLWMVASRRVQPGRDLLLAGLSAAVLLLVGIVALRAGQVLAPLLWPLLVLLGGLTLGAWAHHHGVRGRAQALARERDLALAASRAKSQFLASMSHELRTPLNGVIGAAQLLQQHRGDSLERDQLVEIIRSSGTSLLGMIDSVLDLARIESGALELNPDDFNLVDCIEAAVNTAAVPARAKGLQVACIIDAAVPAWRHSDASRIRQVLLNLLGNAVKFTLRGQVVLRVQTGPMPDEVIFAVEDTGIGISPQALSTVFDRFQQAEQGTRRRFGGSGLGLTICREVVRALGGDLTVRSTPGQGSCFTARMRLAAAQQPPQTPPAAQAMGLVAYVEPHEASAEALQQLLKRMGYEPRRCRSAEDVRAAYRDAEPAGPVPWLLVSQDAPGLLELLEDLLEAVPPERVIGMSVHPWYPADAARDQVQLPRSVLKPVLRSALASRFRAGTGSAGARKDSVSPVPWQGHVLIAEDDLVNQTIVGAMVSQAGYAVTVSGDGQGTLRAFAAQHVDVVLMDWQMPDMDGLEVTRQLRSGAAGPRGLVVPIIALTANAFAEDRAACLAAGMNDFLTKPVVAADLLDALARWTQPASVTSVTPQGSSGPA
jgi:signal transduction histidine kinase/CheY-like chemotaxis protein